MYTIKNRFWSIENCDSESKYQILIMLNLAVAVAKLYGRMIVITLSLLVIQAALKENPTLVMEIWIPHKEMFKKTPYFQILFVLEVFFLTCAVFCCIIPIDQLFIIMTSIVCIQFKLVSKQLLLLNPAQKNNGKIVQSCINQHNIILR